MQQKENARTKTKRIYKQVKKKLIAQTLHLKNTFLFNSKFSLILLKKFRDKNRFHYKISIKKIIDAIPGLAEKEKKILRVFSNA